jgi:hypothetical protein
MFAQKSFDRLLTASNRSWVGAHKGTTTLLPTAANANEKILIMMVTALGSAGTKNNDKKTCIRGERAGKGYKEGTSW